VSGAQREQKQESPANQRPAPVFRGGESVRETSLLQTRLVSLLVFVLSCWSFWGCERTNSSKPTPRLVKKRLLKIPAAQLLPPRRDKGKATLRLPVSDVTEILLTLKKSSSSPTIFRLFRAEKQWWLLRRLPEERHALALVPSFSVKQWIGPLKGLKQLAPKPGVMPAVDDEVVLSGKRGRFIVRLMRLSAAQKDGTWPGGSWQLYRQGYLFQQDAGESLSRSLQSLRSRIRQLRRKGRWLELPLNSWGWSNETLLRLGGELAAHRQQLKTCFKKRKFPSHVGTLRIKMEFQSNGSVNKKKHRLKTRAHQKYGLVWCIWNKSKTWKLRPPVPEFRYLLLVPPHGP
jgi:hypothetical protein